MAVVVCVPSGGLCAQRARKAAGAAATQPAPLYCQCPAAHRQLGRLEDAVADYTTALGLDPRHFKALYNRAFCYDKVGGARAAAPGGDG